MAKATMDPNDMKLMAAASTGDHVSLRMYSEIGGAVNAKDTTDSDRTAVHKAAAGGHEMCLRWLMGLQADFLVKDVSGLTPMHLAARNGHEDCLRYMLDELLLPAEEKDKEDHTPMHEVCAIGITSLLFLILVSPGRKGRACRNHQAPL
jgi:ankyrin repeat protein